MRAANIYFRRHLKYDLSASIVVFLIAVPLCLGIALSSGAPLYSGMVSGIIGGLVVGFLSASTISVCGPAAGIAAVVIAALSQLHDFQTVLLAIFFSGFLQIIASQFRLGFFADYFPSSVVKGMLSAIGILLIFKQIPLAFTLSKNFSELKFHLLEASEGSYIHPLLNLSFHINTGAVFLSSLSLFTLFYFEKNKTKYFSYIPAAIVVVIIGTLLNEWFNHHHSILTQHGPHLVNIPAAYSFGQFWGQLASPNWQAWDNPLVYLYAFIFASITSLESLLNTTASEKLDLKHQMVDKNQELFAQGVGNILAGLMGGLPITTVIINTSVNIQNHAKTKLATMLYGGLLFASFFLLAELINRIPICILASILIYTGYKLTQPKIYLQIYRPGMIRFIPFIITVIAVVLFNVLFGVLLGLLVNIFFILKYNSQARIDIIQETYAHGKINRLILPQQTTFLNKASIIAELNTIPKHSQLIIDARYAEFIDKEITEYIHDFSTEQAPLRHIALNLIGFKENYNISNYINFINVTTYDTQAHLTPLAALNILREGNERFLKGQRIHRSNHIDIQHTSEAQHPIAIVLGCIDSRVPVETVFDMTFGDLFCVRVAGNVINEDILASIEYGCHVVGAKLIVVLGHTGCGAIQSACNDVEVGHITQLLAKIKPAIAASQLMNPKPSDTVTTVTQLNVANSMLEIFHGSTILKNLVVENKIGIVGAIYDIKTGQVKFSMYDSEIQLFNNSENLTFIDAIDQWYHEE